MERNCSRVIHCFLGLLVFCLSLCVNASATPDTLYREGLPEIRGPKSTALKQLPDFTPLARAVSGAIVNISVEGKGEDETVDELAPFPFNNSPEAPSRSTGSGFLISPDGYIATSNHVVDKANRIIVRILNDKNEYTATLIGKDPKTDVALLKIDAGRSLPFTYLGDSDGVEVGEWVIAIGNQFELGQTLTLGIVSAKARRVPSTGGSPYDVYIQTDASINPGSSGGPLVNIRGQVIGVNTAIFTPGRRTLNEMGFNIGIGFAVPINTVKRVLPELKDKGKITRGLLGVIIQQVDQDVAQVLGVPFPEGALVADVIPGSPAKRAGFLRKDVISKFNGRKIEDYNQLPMLVADTQVGSSVDLEVLREGKTINLKVVIEEQKDEQEPEKEQLVVIEEMGIGVVEKPLRVHKHGETESSKKVLVSKILPTSIGEKSGFLVNDRIVEINDTKIKSVEALKEFIKASEKNKPLMILVQRKKSSRFLTLRLK